MGAWQTKPIGEVFRVVNGGTPKTGVSDYWDGHHHWITPAEMGGRTSPYLSESRRRLTDEGLRVGAELVPANSIILSTRAPIGHLVINTVPMAFNQGCKGLVPSTGIDTKFAYYFLLANVPLLESLGTGATFKELSGGKLKEVQFHFPVLSEQRRIVAILDEAFAGIATAKANAERNLQNARELFDVLLQSALSLRGEAWRMRSLGDERLLEIIDGDRGANYPKASDFLDEGHCLFLNTKNVRPDGFDFESTMFVTAEKDGQLRKGKLRRDDVVMTTRGTIGNIGIYSEDVPFNNIRINSGMLVLRANKRELLPSFLFELLRSDIVKSQIRTKTTGAAQPQLPIRTLVSFEIPVPESVEVQAVLVRKIRGLEPEANRLADIYGRKLTALDNLAESLLHRAFTGALTAKSTDQKVAEVA